MAGYVTYKKAKEGAYLVPDPENDPFTLQDDPMTVEDLIALEFEPKEFPVDHGDGKLDMELCFVDPEGTLIYGPDDLRNYQNIQDTQEQVPLSSDVAKSILNMKVVSIVDNNKLLSKSLYNFELTSVEGINNILESLPIMDPELVRQIAEDIWPGIDTSEKDPKQLKLEIKGYLMDHLHMQNALPDS